jgi:p-aminobenzoyl-glutamate transporter AbgT
VGTVGETVGTGYIAVNTAGLTAAVVISLLVAIPTLAFIGETSILSSYIPLVYVAPLAVIIFRRSGGMSLAQIRAAYAGGATADTYDKL